MFKRIMFGALISAFAAAPAAALASPVLDKGNTPAAVEQLAFGDKVAWAVPLEDESLSEMRGGAGLMFSVFFSGALEFNDSGTGTGTEGLTVSQPGDNLVQITGGLGNFGGASGVFQFTNVEGSMNVVNNSMVVNVAIVNDPSVNLSTLFSAGP